MIKFRPTQTFEASPTGVKSVYLEGMVYRANNPALLAAVREWEKRGEVTIVLDNKGTRTATARGKLEVL